MNPVITKMMDFVIIVNGFQLFAIVPKSSILNVVGFLDPLLLCNKFAAEVAGWFKSKRMVMYTFIPQQKVFEQIRETYFGQPNFIKLYTFHIPLSYIQFSVGSKVWVSFSWITFQSLHDCIASSFHNVFHLVHHELHDEANTCIM